MMKPRSEQSQGQVGPGRGRSVLGCFAAGPLLFCITTVTKVPTVYVALDGTAKAHRSSSKLDPGEWEAWYLVDGRSYGQLGRSSVRANFEAHS